MTDFICSFFNLRQESLSDRLKIRAINNSDRISFETASDSNTWPHNGQCNFPAFLLPLTRSYLFIYLFAAPYKCRHPPSHFVAYSDLYMKQLDKNIRGQLSFHDLYPPFPSLKMYVHAEGEQYRNINHIAKGMWKGSPNYLFLAFSYMYFVSLHCFYCLTWPEGCWKEKCRASLPAVSFSPVVWHQLFTMDCFTLK